MLFRGFIPRRFEIIVFSFFLSMFMSCLVSGISTFATVGFIPNFLQAWGRNFISSWMVAFPAVLIVAPLVRRLTAVLLIDE